MFRPAGEVDRSRQEREECHRPSPFTIRSLQGGPIPVERALLITLGGAIGTLVRYLTSVAAARWLGADFPYGTLIVNLSGAFIIGLVQQLGTEALVISDDLRLFLTTGILGGLTTYSTFSYETVRLLEVGASSQAWINVSVTTVLCLGLCFLGMSVGRILVAARG
jgi:CrcB protein